MKLRYVESMKKKKQDEERLRQIKMQQELHIKEINELKQKAYGRTEIIIIT